MHFSQKQKTAVIYFTLSPEAQVEQKVFAEGSSLRINASIASILCDHTLRQIQTSELPYFLFDESNQQGSSFGQKISLAFEEIFKKGYENVIVVGSDTPQLRSSHLKRASELLNSNRSDVVLGPAADGGTWLMGFQKNALNLDTFKSLPWNTSHLFSAILEEYQNADEIAVFEQYGDIDREDDLHQLLTSSTEYKEIKQLLQTIAQLLTSTVSYKIIFKDAFSSDSHSHSFLLRGPPSTSDFVRFIN